MVHVIVIILYATQKSLNIHSTEKCWKLIIEQYYTHIHIYIYYIILYYIILYYIILYYIIYIYLCSFLLGPRVQKRCHVNLFFKRLGSSFFLPSKTSACGSQIASAMTSSSGTWRPRLVSQTYHNLGYHGHVLINTAGLSGGLVHVNLVSSRMMFQWLGFQWLWHLWP